MRYSSRKTSCTCSVIRIDYDFQPEKLLRSTECYIRVSTCTKSAYLAVTAAGPCPVDSWDMAGLTTVSSDWLSFAECTLSS